MTPGFKLFTESFPGLHPPGRSYFTDLLYDPWVQTIYRVLPWTTPTRTIILYRLIIGLLGSNYLQSPSLDYTHPDDHTLPTYYMTPGFKLFTESFPGLHPPGRSYFTDLLYDSWVQTIYRVLPWTTPTRTIILYRLII